MSIFDSKFQVDVAVLDFSKAFDGVPHQRLLGKIKHYWISDTTLAWISDFLSGRTQRVVVDGSYSEWSTVHSAMPEGTVLGPLLVYYILTTYQIVSIAGSGCLPTIVCCTGKLEALKTSLRCRDPDAFEVWASTWGMKFNPSKYTTLSIARSSAMHKFYTLCGTVLQHVSEAKYIGVTLSDDLQWSKHISNLSVKASSTLGLLRQNLPQCPQALREQAYISRIRSRLEYWSAIWDPQPGQRYRFAREHPEASRTTVAILAYQRS